MLPSHSPPTASSRRCFSSPTIRPTFLLTQILIETVSTIFILLIIFFMPPFRPDRSPAIKKVVNLGIALAVGAFMFTYTLLTTSPQFKEMDNLAGEYLARALDRRAAPTLSMSSSLISEPSTPPARSRFWCSSACACFLFCGAEGTRGRRHEDRDLSCPPDRGAYGGAADGARVRRHLSFRATTCRAAASSRVSSSPQPGPCILLAFGVEPAKRLNWWKISVFGLFISLTTGTVPLFLGRPFMQHSIWNFHLPVIGNFHLPTATFFDLGVYLIVFGTLMTIFVELAQERGK